MTLSLLLLLLLERRRLSKVSYSVHGRLLMRAELGRDLSELPAALTVEEQQLLVPATPHSPAISPAVLCRLL